MILDTSAVVAIFFNEPEREPFLQKIQADSRRLLSAATLLEIHIVFARASGEPGLRVVDAFLQRFAIQVVPFDHPQSIIASQAFQQFGRGRHPARLNFGDCFTYALARHTGEPVLFKGDDFLRTDLLLA